MIYQAVDGERLDMKDKRVMIFAGTTEGRRLTQYMADNGICVHVCTATQYGESLLPERENITASHERMNCEEMCVLIRSFSPALVIDATHPYAAEATENIRKACGRCSAEYLRLVRDREDGAGDVVCVESTEAAVRFLEKTKGNILVTTGSRELEKYTALTDYRERIYARVLPFVDSVAKCGELGIEGRHLICMQGPFSAEMNGAVIREYEIANMVTKESGQAGGYPQKYEAAKAAGINLVVIGRPEEKGYTYREILKFLKKKYSTAGYGMQRVTVAGIGPGAPGLFTEQVREACRKADLIIGAGRMVEAAARKGQARYVSYRPEEILNYIKGHPEYGRVAVIFSGDTGFYSGAGKLWRMLEREADIESELLPGISSVSYFCAKLGVSWEDAALMSLHGRKGNPLSVIRENEKTIVITGSDRDVREICLSMTEAGFGNLPVCIGSQLSYDGEQIFRGKAKDYIDYSGGKLAVLYVENFLGKSRAASHGLPDSAFVRGDVPMTKEEVRCVCISKLRIRKDSVVYDVGAGTGSVTVEAALCASEGHVYAVERKQEAIHLIRENGRRMKTDNITVVDGEAPEAFRELPAPDCVFIGGSGGALKEIVEAVVRKNPKVRVVISAVTLETLSEAAECCKSVRKSEEEIIQLSVAEARKIGKYHLMQGQNPVYVISFTCGGKGE